MRTKTLQIAFLEVYPLISADAEKLVIREVLTVLEMDFQGDSRWERFVASHPDALIYHHPGWLSALESEYGQKCVSLACVDEQGQVCAVLPLFYTKGLPLHVGPLSTNRRLSSLPRTPEAGLLATSKEGATAILEHAVGLVRSKPGVQLEIKTKIADLDKSVDALVCKPWRPTYVAELPVRVEGAAWEAFWETLRFPRTCVSCQDCRQLRFGNARRQHRVNWSVNKAIKLGLEVREAETEEESGRMVSALSSDHAPQRGASAAVPVISKFVVVLIPRRTDAFAPSRAKQERRKKDGGGIRFAAIRPDCVLRFHGLRAGGFLSSSSRHIANRSDSQRL